MTQSATVIELSKLIKELRSERQQHVDAIARIDQTFEQFGISPDKGSYSVKAVSPAGKSKGAAKKPASGKKTSKKKSSGKRRGPNSFAVTGEESVLGFIAQHGEANSKEINAHWANEGRGGKANNTLTKLVKDKKLKRVKNANERGSRYKLN